MRLAKWAVASAAVLLAIVASPAGAQTPADSPHGPLALDCAICHNTADWSVAPRPPAFDHGRSGFPLAGRHAAVKCGDCHRDLTFGHVGSACADCHVDAHRGQLGPNCERCHAPTGWESRGVLFEQHAERGFPLVGVHAAADCEACHVDQQRQDFVGNPVTCYGCHANDYAATREPSHLLTGFSTDCSQCHVPTASWRPVFVQHTPAFPLRNAHARTGCLSCHASGYAGTSPLCYSCHADDYNGTQEPPHVASGLATACEQCHTDAGWGGGTFDHAVSTGFALTGAHVSLACTACHVNGLWAGTPQDCYSCHAADYNGTTDPPHAASGMPTTCQQCHSTTTWGDGTFDHAVSTGFALTGAHATTTCTTCHVDGQWSGLPQDCDGCHAATYNATTDPAHTAANFPRTCQTCHTTLAWQPSTWNHETLFPINSGAHRTVWASCATCHVNPADYGVFECIDCHEHNRTDTDGHHDGVRNYEYLSTACYSCHPNGRAD